MAMYYSITASFGYAPCPPDLVERGYTALAEAGFPFKEGYAWANGLSLEEITAFNQRLFDEEFTLAGDQHMREGRKQVLLESARFSEARAFWSYHRGTRGMSLTVIVPEEEYHHATEGAYGSPDIITLSDGSYFMSRSAFTYLEA